MDPTAILTGTTSGVGLYAADALRFPALVAFLRGR
jgi:NAD(P)-dependent dehydrogenase (short-subunit alcohol dehydrogenase family)